MSEFTLNEETYYKLEFIAFNKKTKSSQYSSDTKKAVIKFMEIYPEYNCIFKIQRNYHTLYKVYHRCGTILYSSVLKYKAEEFIEGCEREIKREEKIRLKKMKLKLAKINRLKIGDRVLVPALPYGGISDRDEIRTIKEIEHNIAKFEEGNCMGLEFLKLARKSRRR